MGVPLTNAVPDATGGPEIADRSTFQDAAAAGEYLRGPSGVLYYDADRASALTGIPVERLRKWTRGPRRRIRSVKTPGSRPNVFLLAEDVDQLISRARASEPTDSDMNDELDRLRRETERLRNETEALSAKVIEHEGTIDRMAASQLELAAANLSLARQVRDFTRSSSGRPRDE